MGTACGRAGVLGSALIHTKTGAHREDVAQHAGDRFGSPITRRPDAAALSDGADSPPVSIPVLRMPPRKPQMTGSGIAQRLPCRATSQSVTSTGRNQSLLLQIEINNLSRSETSQSVTVTGQIGSQMLQTETEGDFRPVQTKSLSLPAISNMWPIMLLWLRYILRSHLIRRPPGAINSYRHIG